MMGKTNEKRSAKPSAQKRQSPINAEAQNAPVVMHDSETTPSQHHEEIIEEKGDKILIHGSKKARAGPTPKLQIEALLFSSGKTMSEESLAELSKLDPRTVKRALHDLQAEYETRDSAIKIYNDPTGWKMMVRELYVSTVKNIVADTELTRACMETLAIIAYKYPKVLQSEVIDIRGSGAYEHMAELERLGFIGRYPEGRSYAVKLTDKFFSYFDVAGGKDIREVFKNIKVPKRVTVDAQKTLGDLQIVDVKALPKEHASNAKRLDGMEVISVSPETEQPAIAAAVDEENDNTESRVEQGVQDAEEHSAFLDDLDKRIAAISERNTVNENDETLKRRPLPGAETPTESSNSDSVAPEEAPKEETDKKE